MAKRRSARSVAALKGWATRRAKAAAEAARAEARRARARARYAERKAEQRRAERERKRKRKRRELGGPELPPPPPPPPIGPPPPPGADFGSALDDPLSFLDTYQGEWEDYDFEDSDAHTELVE